MYAESAAAAVTRHVHPVWKVVLPVGGTVCVAAGAGRPWHAPGAVVPPGLAHTCATSSGFLALFVDAWRLPPAAGALPLDAGAALRLLRALDNTAAEEGAGEAVAAADTGTARRGRVRPGEGHITPTT
ncbi:hypothetical protein CLV63_104205 [Murinocardiopsis flavida]|uniref:AraC-like protein n=1 Tax=Murinocardiopsis flavida TaxID=645275 RepID=A0A2P8DP48_9ACTN|nr:hypothetical protein CLV63_104205 [Murinocardiopsis flavida]